MYTKACICIQTHEGSSVFSIGFFFNAMEVALDLYPYMKDADADVDDHVCIWL